MSPTGEYKAVQALSSFVLIAIFTAAIVSVVSYQMWMTSGTMPASIKEGFAGPIHIAGVPDCIQNSDDAAKLYTTFSSKASTTEEGQDDLRELGVLLGKLACFKRDLMSAGHLVNATKSQPFYTSQDLEPIAETAARCFSLTIPVRDIDIALDKWNSRGKMLLKRLCTSYSTEPTQQKTATDLFKNFMDDIANIMKTVCLKGDATIAGQPTPRMVEGKEPGENAFYGQYKGYY